MQRFLSSLPTKCIVGKKMVVLPYSRKLRPLLNKLIVEGIIMSYTQNENMVYIIINYNNFGNASLQFCVTFTNTYLNWKACVRIRKLTTLFLIATPQGVLTAQEAIMLKKGGKLLCVFF